MSGSNATTEVGPMRPIFGKPLHEDAKGAADKPEDYEIDDYYQYVVALP
eukprot:CAMPEP_0194041592 /NCGR_PEP_ID=MMETSP0009_2-20130614/13479_1 /TAXON_ID=210454 /ORGANISM="Grammatophora oceanica, Strain CCMP 410" /LENGTH=48 /DNA_ID= /DNA_START= /DNA_END= /DNA_ORIENTATION=